MPNETYNTDLSNCLTDEEKKSHSDKQWAEQDPDIQKKYAGKVIAVRDFKVIAQADNITALHKKIARMKQKDPEFGRFVVVPIKHAAK